MHLVTGADLFSHQRMTVEKAVRANALHKRIPGTISTPRCMVGSW